jgi:phenylalanyl-tRNA synthetase beta chain
VALEVAHFDPVGVRRTARRHKLVTDAHYRFERGVDPNLPAARLGAHRRAARPGGGRDAAHGVTMVGADVARP